MCIETLAHSRTARLMRIIKLMLTIRNSCVTGHRAQCTWKWKCTDVKQGSMNGDADDDNVPLIIWREDPHHDAAFSHSSGIFICIFGARCRFFTHTSFCTGCGASAGSVPSFIGRTVLSRGPVKRLAHSGSGLWAKVWRPQIYTDVEADICLQNMC